MMSMRDPELDLRVTPRAFGTYSIQIVDPVRFIIGYTGQAAQGDNEQITLWLRQRMFQALGKTLGGFLKGGQTTFMDLGGVAPDLAAAMARDCPDFSEIGVKMLEIGELKITLSDEDQARVDELQDQMAEAKLKARMAKVGISQAEAEAQQKQFALDQQFAQDGRYVQQLAGGSYQNYAAGQAMMGSRGTKKDHAGNRTKKGCSINPFLEIMNFIKSLVERQHNQEGSKHLSALQQNPQFLQHVVQASLFGNFAIIFQGFSMGFGIFINHFLLLL